jgi:hypothetical protein
MLPLAIGAVLVINSYLHRRLLVAAQPLRLELAKRGDALLRDSHLPPRARGMVTFVLDHAFGMSALLAIAIVAIPVAVPIMIVRGEMQRDADETASMKGALRAEYDQLMSLHGRIIFATNPFLMTVALLEMFLIAAPLVLFTGALAGNLMPEVNQTALLHAIETEASMLGRRRAAAA